MGGWGGGCASALDPQMDGQGWVSSHSWRAPADLFLAHIRPQTSLSGPLTLGSQPPHKRALYGRARAARRIFVPHPHPFPEPWQECGSAGAGSRKRGCGPDGARGQGANGSPASRSWGSPASGASSLSLPSGPPASPLPPFSLHPPLFTSPHFAVFSPSLPLCSSPGWVSESYGEPGDRPGFILGKSIHDRGYHSNKLPWCLDTR